METEIANCKCGQSPNASTGGDKIKIYCAKNKCDKRIEIIKSEHLTKAEQKTWFGVSYGYREEVKVGDIAIKKWNNLS